MPRSSLPAGYAQRPQPILEGRDKQYLDQELTAVGVAIGSLLRMTPQPATVAPKAPADGMIRLSRSPWRPLSGQTVDAWVYFDGPTAAWKPMP